jgi:hypothetical protein
VGRSFSENDDGKLRAEMRKLLNAYTVEENASITLLCNANGSTTATISVNLRPMSLSRGNSQGRNFELDGQVVEFVRLRVHRSY